MSIEHKNETMNLFEHRCIAYVRLMAEGICRKPVRVERVRPLGSKVCRAVIIPDESDTRHLIGRSGRVFKAMKTLSTEVARLRPCGEGTTFWLETVRVPAVRDEGLRITEEIIPGALKSEDAARRIVKELVTPFCPNAAVRIMSPAGGEFYVVLIQGSKPDPEVEESARIIIGAIGVPLGAVLRAEWSPA